MERCRWVPEHSQVPVLVRREWDLGRWVLAGCTDMAECWRMVRQGPNSAAGEGFQLLGGCQQSSECQGLAAG